MCVQSCMCSRVGDTCKPTFRVIFLNNNISNNNINSNNNNYDNNNNNNYDNNNNNNYDNNNNNNKRQ